MQETQWDFEVLVIDSGSSDRTVERVQEHPLVRLHQIPNSEFGHGKTRNLGATLARGEYVAYLSHDAIPASPFWLHEITKPLDPQGLNAAAVLGKQVARPGCFPLLKYEIREVFQRFGPNYGTTLFYVDDFARSRDDVNAMAFYSDVNSATRRSFVLDVIPYQDVLYSEDMAFGLDVIEGGFIKAYAPQAVVEHSNDLTLREYRMRLFDEITGLRRIGKDLPPLRWSRQFIYPLYGAGIDSLRIVADKEMSLGSKFRWLVVNPFFHWAKWRSFYRSTHVDLNDKVLVDKGSLESARLAAAEVAPGLSQSHR
ncbi:rhamnosyltransferase [Alpinimonas psychrophila]|uniref:Rhamnosyltransferase n=1 Tax=Alpinimonas psychrophila TaxID=748908 RepID=A0A7W3JU65_9MICO|nr:rhamnosyltransferase [Alpinimonas psychrophila]